MDMQVKLCCGCKTYASYAGKPVRARLDPLPGAPVNHVETD